MRQGKLVRISSIDLPDYDNEYRSVSTPYYPIFVTEKQEIILFADTIDVYALSWKIMHGIPNFNNGVIIPNIQAHLIIDKKVPYQFVDLVKTQVASTKVSKDYFYYRNSPEESITSRVKAIRNPNHLAFFNIRAEPVITKRYLRIRDSIRKINEASDLPIPPKPIALNTITSVEKAIYTLQPDAIDEALENKKCICLELKRDGLYEGKVKKVDIGDSKGLYGLYSGHDVVLLKFDKELIYQDYFNYLMMLDGNSEQLQKVEIVELSQEIIAVHQSAKIVLTPCEN